MDTRTVLVVEDCADARELFCEALEMNSLNAVSFADGEDALAYLESAEELPGVALVDLSLPQMSGEEFIRRLKSDPQFASIKLLISSGWDDLKQKAQLLGADGYLRKPFELTEFHSQVDRCLLLPH